MAGERDKRFAEKASHMQERVNLNADINTKIRTLRKELERCQITEAARGESLNRSIKRENALRVERDRLRDALEEIIALDKKRWRVGKAQYIARTAIREASE